MLVDDTLCGEDGFGWTCWDGSSLFMETVRELVVAYKSTGWLVLWRYKTNIACQQLSICWFFLFTERVGSSLLLCWPLWLLSLCAPFSVSARMLDYTSIHSFFAIPVRGYPMTGPSSSSASWAYWWACQLCVMTPHDVSGFASNASRSTGVEYCMC